MATQIFNSYLTIMEPEDESYETVLDVSFTALCIFAYLLHTHTDNGSIPGRTTLEQVALTYAFSNKPLVLLWCDVYLQNEQRSTSIDQYRSSKFHRILITVIIFMFFSVRNKLLSLSGYDLFKCKHFKGLGR